MCFEVLSSSEWRYDQSFLPNHFIQLTENDISKKCSAMLEYPDEILPFPHPRSVDGIRTLAKYRGMQSGFEYAEAFRIVRDFNL